MANMFDMSGCYELGHVKHGEAGRPELKSLCRCKVVNVSNGQVAQLVEQRTENPCVGGSIPPLATISFNPIPEKSRKPAC